MGVLGLLECSRKLPKIPGYWKVKNAPIALENSQKFGNESEFSQKKKTFESRDWGFQKNAAYSVLVVFF